MKDYKTYTIISIALEFYYYSQELHNVLVARGSFYKLENPYHRKVDAKENGPIYSHKITLNVILIL